MAWAVGKAKEDQLTMEKSVEKTGKTIQEAVQLAIDELGVDLGDVKIDIHEEPERASGPYK